MTDDQYLTVEQAAERLQLGPETVRRMLRDGRLHGVRLGGTRAGWRVAASDVERILRPDPIRRPGPRPAARPHENGAILLANLRAQAERARERGDEDGAAAFEAMAASMAPEHVQ
jgi:excisionase family DNA binding protein